MLRISALAAERYRRAIVSIRQAIEMRETIRVTHLGAINEMKHRAARARRHNR